MKNLEKTERNITDSNGEIIFSSVVELNKANMFHLYSVRNIWNVGKTGWKIHNTNVVEFNDKEKAKKFYESIVSAIDEALDETDYKNITDNEVCDRIKIIFYDEIVELE